MQADDDRLLFVVIMIDTHLYFETDEKLIEKVQTCKSFIRL